MNVLDLSDVEFKDITICSIGRLKIMLACYHSFCPSGKVSVVYFTNDSIECNNPLKLIKIDESSNRPIDVLRDLIEALNARAYYLSKNIHLITCVNVSDCNKHLYGELIDRWLDDNISTVYECIKDSGINETDKMFSTNSGKIKYFIALLSNKLNITIGPNGCEMGYDFIADILRT